MARATQLVGSIAAPWRTPPPPMRSNGVVVAGSRRVGWCAPDSHAASSNHFTRTQTAIYAHASAPQPLVGTGHVQGSLREHWATQGHARYRRALSTRASEAIAWRAMEHASVNRLVNSLSLMSSVTRPSYSRTITGPRGRLVSVDLMVLPCALPSYESSVKRRWRCSGRLRMISLIPGLSGAEPPTAQCERRVYGERCIGIELGFKSVQGQARPELGG